MPNETVETYTNIYARWFAIISQFIVTASLCTLWRLQMTRYSQVLVHSTVVNSRLSHQYMSISPFLWGFLAEFRCCFGDFCSFSYFLPGLFQLLGWVWGAVLGLSAVSATFSRVFSGFLAEFRCCFGDFCSFSYFLLGLFWLLGWVWGAVLGFLQFQLLFLGFSPALWLGSGSCFGDFCSFSYFLRASGIMLEAQHHKLTTTYWKKPLVSLISRTQL